MEATMKKNIIIGLLLSVLVNQVKGAALARRLATTAARVPLHLRKHGLNTLKKDFHSYRDIVGTLSALPKNTQDVSPLHGAVAIASGDVQQWQQQENKKELFKALFHERDNTLYATVAIGNPISSLDPQLWGKFVTMTSTSSFNLDTFLMSDFVKQWHAVHFKKTGRYEKLYDFRKQVKRVINPLIKADKVDQTTALAATTCLKFPTRQELQKVFEHYENFDAAKFQVNQRFNDSTLYQAKQLLQNDTNYSPQEQEKITFLALESTRAGANALLKAPFQSATYKGQSVPPCTEVALRTFINTILVNPKTNLLSLDALPKGITVNPEFKAFITKYANPEIQNYYTNSKDEWMALTSDKSKVKYLRGTTEMAGEMHNSLALLNHYFGTNAKTLAEFGKILSTDTKEIIIEDKNEQYGNYNVSIKTADKTFNGEWGFSKGHVDYYLERENYINFLLMDLLRLSKIKKGKTSLLSLIPKNQQRSIFARSVNHNLHGPSWTFDALAKICEILKIDLATFLFEDESNLLHTAAYCENLDLIQPLVQAGVPLEQKNHEGLTPLLTAIKTGNILIIEALVKLGANINAKNRLGDTPLHRAIEIQNISMIELLIKLGADINATSELGDPPLNRAIEAQNISMIELLIKFGANINTKNRLGNPPLHQAIEIENLSMIELLIKLGANINATSEWGQTPLTKAIEKFGKDHDIIKKIYQLGGREHADFLESTVKFLYVGVLFPLVVDAAFIAFTGQTCIF